jgi:hypothetical protein
LQIERIVNAIDDLIEQLLLKAEGFKHTGWRSPDELRKAKIVLTLG